MASDTEDQDGESGGKSADSNGKHTHEDHDKTPKSKTKKQPDVLCNCPQKCSERISKEVRLGLFEEFSRLGDHYRQNAYLQSYIEMRSVYKRLWCQEERVGGRLQRRVSCKYRLPVEVPRPLLPLEPHRPPKLSTNSKGKMTVVVASKPDVKTVEVCQKAFMNIYGITEKRIRLQREKLIARLRNSSSKTVTSAEEITTLAAIDHPHDIAMVDSFFQNQLWKPEYIGPPVDLTESNVIKA